MNNSIGVLTRLQNAMNRKMGYPESCCFNDHAVALYNKLDDAAKFIKEKEGGTLVRGNHIIEPKKADPMRKWRTDRELKLARLQSKYKKPEELQKVKSSPNDALTKLMELAKVPGNPKAKWVADTAQKLLQENPSLTFGSPAFIHLLEEKAEEAGQIEREYSKYDPEYYDKSASDHSESQQNLLNPREYKMMSHAYSGVRDSE